MNLSRKLIGLRADWNHIEDAVRGINDPELLEHTAICGIAMLHVADRLEELHEDHALDEVLLVEATA